MLSVMIVDDEEIIRNRIRRIINWGKAGCRIVAEAEDGEQALELARRQYPDVLITDIKMPFMDGLELIRTIRKENPATFCVLLTGYDEFQFAQQAIEHGAVAYLLKPLEVDSLHSVLKKIRRSHRQARSKAEELDRLQVQVHRLSQHAKEYVLKNVLHAVWSRQTMTTELASLQIDGINSYCVVAVVEADRAAPHERNSGDTGAPLCQRLYDFLHGRAQDEDTALVIEGELKYSVCMWDQDRERLSVRTAAFKNSLLKDADAENLAISVCFGGIYRSFLNLTRSYVNARTLMEYESLGCGGEDVEYREIAAKLCSESLDIDFDFSPLIAAVRSRDFGGIDRGLEEMAENIRSRGENTALLCRAMVDYVLIRGFDLLKPWKDRGAAPALESPIVILKRLDSLKTINDKIAELRKVLCAVSERISGFRRSRLEIVAQEAQQYLSDNYMNKYLSIEDAAREVKVKPNYLSMVFRQELGTTPINYLTLLRLERARDLLSNTNCKVCEAAELVGYDNATYFSTVFKKHFGVSPSEFRKQRAVSGPRERVRPVEGIGGPPVGFADPLYAGDGGVG